MTTSTTPSQADAFRQAASLVRPYAPNTAYMLECDADVEERPRLAPVECFGWCQYGNGHPNATLTDDQTCFTAETHIPGALLVHDPGCEDEEEYVTVHAMGWAAGHRPTQIQVGRGEDIGMQLTIDEAAQVARAILRTIATVDGATERTVLAEELGFAVCLLYTS